MQNTSLSREACIVLRAVRIALQAIDNVLLVVLIARAVSIAYVVSIGIAAPNLEDSLHFCTQVAIEVNGPSHYHL